MALIPSEFQGMFSAVRLHVDDQLKKIQDAHPRLAGLRGNISTSVVLSVSDVADADAKELLEGIGSDITALLHVFVWQWTYGNVKLVIAAKYGKQSETTYAVPATMTIMNYSTSETVQEGEETTIRVRAHTASYAGTQYWFQGVPPADDVQVFLMSIVDEFFKQLSK